jgi:hypothetical protein
MHARGRLAQRAGPCAGRSRNGHRLLLAQRDLIEHTYEVISTLEAILQQVTDAETGP